MYNTPQSLLKLDQKKEKLVKCTGCGNSWTYHQFGRSPPDRITCHQCGRKFPNPLRVIDGVKMTRKMTRKGILFVVIGGRTYALVPSDVVKYMKIFDPRLFCYDLQVVSKERIILDVRRRSTDFTGIGSIEP